MNARILSLEGDNVKLVVSDEGKINLNLFSQFYKVAYHGLQHFGDMSFIMAYSGEGSRTKIFFPIKLSIEPDIVEFFDYWNEEKLNELKGTKAKSFLSYLNYCLDFIRDNVDVEGLKPTYKTEYIDNTDYGGGISTYIYIYLKCGKDWDNNFKITNALNEQLSSELIDRHFVGEDDYYWFSNIIVQFRPLDDYREDF